MCAAVGVPGTEALFDEIPAALRTERLTGVPAGLGEMQIVRLMQERARKDGHYLNFIGAGAYEHHIPAAVWQIATRGEFYSAYTPYQAEASQGTLQVLYEFQTMITSLAGLDAANASLYDGASALAEAILMAVRLHKNGRRVIIPANLNPRYRKVASSIVSNQQVEVVEVPFIEAEGCVDADWLVRHGGMEIAALVIQQPNFFGTLEKIDDLTNWAHEQGALVIACVNPISLAVLKPPGRWGSAGADIAVGEGQPLGVPLSNGGPYFGFMACKQAHVRQMPGRIVGATVDTGGNRGFTLTLQAREQHIRRSKATSNICTNQGLAVTAAAIYMALLGPTGLQSVASHCHANLRALVGRLARFAGVGPVFASPCFHECVLRMPVKAADVLARMRDRGILGGYDLSADYPGLGNTLLVCCTETRTQDDLDAYCEALEAALNA